MRAVVQRVEAAEVRVGVEIVGEIGRGLLVYLGAERDDGGADVTYTAEKIVGLRIFPDDAGRMGRSVVDVAGEILVVSQFTLLGDLRRGRRPSFDRAAPPEIAMSLYEDAVAAMRDRGPKVATGRFRATLAVAAVVDGPVTILIDSRRAF